MFAHDKFYRLSCLAAGRWRLLDTLTHALQGLVSHKGAIILGFLAVFLIGGVLRPFAKPQVRSMRRIAKNLSLAGLNALLSPLLVIPVTVFAAQWALTWRPEWWQGGWGLALDFVLLDAWLYVWHRANHVLPVLWRFHEVHHLDETLDASTALRFHFGEVIASSLLRAVVIFLLGVPLASVLLFETIVAMASIFHHSNLRLPAALERALAWVIVTPSIHWVHHHAQRVDTDSNYATVFSVWDRLFGSRSATVRTVDMQMGVEGGRDVGFLGLVARPVRA
jgi:sterol desaturase/sphingolipid hydroxylase (fatty acid hydroxylase superfamily)